MRSFREKMRFRLGLRLSTILVAVTVMLEWSLLSGQSGSWRPTPSTAEIFRRPVLSRAYEQTTWVLRDASGTGDRESPASVGMALAHLHPTYVSGLIYLEHGTAVTPKMVKDWDTMRSTVLAQNPLTKFDVEISLNPNPPAPKKPFASAEALVAMMRLVDSELHPNAWWFDFYSEADPDWTAAAVAYAHSHGELIGGNVFTDAVPAGSDAVAFVDKPVSGSYFGFDFNRVEVAALKSASPSTLLLGHLQSNAQNGKTSESCVYIDNWNESERAAYLRYWASQQSVVGFTFMYPVFYPLCPGAYAFDPLQDPGPRGGTLYDAIEWLMSEFNPVYWRGRAPLWDGVQ